MLENKEVWKDVKGYEGKYQVSNQGRVWSVGSQKYLYGTANHDGYLSVHLTAKNGKCKKEFIHRLVAIAFIDNPEIKPEVNHKDENKQNNCVENLEWMTHVENSNYGTRNKRAGESNSIDIYCIELDKVFHGIREAGRITGICHTSIHRCCKGQLKTAGGYHWEYYNGN